MSAAIRVEIPNIPDNVDLGAIVRQGADTLLNVSRLSFRNSATPNGDAWPSLAESTIKQRRQKSDVPLRDTGILMASLIASEPYSSGGGMAADVGSNLEYAAIHNFGGMAGRNRAVKIPQRRYLVDGDNVPDDVAEELQQIAINEIMGAFA